MHGCYIKYRVNRTRNITIVSFNSREKPCRICIRLRYARLFSYLFCFSRSMKLIDKRGVWWEISIVNLTFVQSWLMYRDTCKKRALYCAAHTARSNFAYFLNGCKRMQVSYTNTSKDNKYNNEHVGFQSMILLIRKSYRYMFVETEQGRCILLYFSIILDSHLSFCLFTRIFDAIRVIIKAACSKSVNSSNSSFQELSLSLVLVLLRCFSSLYNWYSAYLNIWKVAQLNNKRSCT